jgi:hypothetical protein
LIRRAENELSEAAVLLSLFYVAKGKISFKRSNAFWLLLRAKSDKKILSKKKGKN